MTTAPKKGVQAYPLKWPNGVPRIKVRVTSQFADRSIAACIPLLREELSRLRATGVVISTNIPLKPNGDPYSDKTKLPDPGVAVYFQLDGRDYCMPCDKWATVEENLWAIAKNVEAMRGMRRWGVGSTEQAFAGFKALTATATEENWWDVLDVQPNASSDYIQAAYRTLIRTAHPDVPGGSEAAMQRLNSARDRALAQKGLDA